MKKLNNIVLISSGVSHFMALERQDIPPISEWDHIKVREWFLKIGLGGCANLIKYKQINGT